MFGDGYRTRSSHASPREHGVQTGFEYGVRTPVAFGLLLVSSYQLFPVGELR